jgi:excisionase family DNA binding protein
MAFALRFVPPMENDLERLRLLTLKETAALLHISPQRVHRMIQRKHMRAVRVGKQWRVRISEITKWMQGLNEL